jgi:nucleoid DNA-binding protein
MAAKPKPKKPAAVKPVVSPSPAATPQKPRATAKVAPTAPAPAKPPQVQPASTADALRKKDLIDKVVTITGAKKALVRDVVEATLTVLGDALSKGAMLNLPPFGKAKVARASDAASGRPMTVKLRRSPAGGQAGQNKAKAALADAED